MKLKTKKGSIALLIIAMFSTAGWRCKDNTNEVAPPPPPPNEEMVEALIYLSKSDASVQFAQQGTELPVASVTQRPTIEINTSVSYQSMDGFGFSLTGGSALHLSKMSAGERSKLLYELFDTSGDNIGVSYLRVSLGASDLDKSVFSYNDLPAGQTDVNMEQFSLAPDKRYLIPVLKEIIAIQPDIKIMASPWSPPAWMKSNNHSVGGSLKPEFYDAYGKSF